MSDYHEMAAAAKDANHHEYRASVLGARKQLVAIIALQTARIESASRDFASGKMPLVVSERITQHANGYIDGLRKALELVRV